jgi:hypothetical protein
MATIKAGPLSRATDLMHPIFTLLANRRKQRAAVMASHDNVTDLYGDVALNSSDQHRVGFARNSHARHKPKPL